MRFVRNPCVLDQTSTKYCLMYTYHGMTDQTEVKIELEEMIKDDVVLFDKYVFPSSVMNGAILFHSTKVIYTKIYSMNVLEFKQILRTWKFEYAVSLLYISQYLKPIQSFTFDHSHYTKNYSKAMDFLTYTKEILDGKLHFLCEGSKISIHSE